MLESLNVSCQNTELQAFLAASKVLSSLLKFMFNSAQKEHGSRSAALKYPVHMRQFMCIADPFFCKPFRKTFHHNAPSTACLFLSFYLQFFHVKRLRFFLLFFLATFQPFCRLIISCQGIVVFYFVGLS